MTAADGLKISRALTLPLDYVTKTGAILAKRRVGKTYTAAVLAEELCRLGIPWYALDPTGAWWGLRSSSDGTRAGLPVVVLGGEHGDVPITEHDGKAIADLIVDQPGFYVIDLSEIDESHAATVRFATAFFARLYARKNKQRDPLHGFWDEGDLFAPQKPGPEETKMLGSAEAIVRRGGLRGLGTTLITQRAAVINKNVLSQLDILIILRTIGPQDQDAVEDYIKRNGSLAERREIMDSLAALAIGEAWLYGPGEEPPLRVRVRIRKRRTFNSSATPKAGEARVEPTKLASVDVEALRERFAEQVEKAKAEDPAHLRRQIVDLQRERDALMAAGNTDPPFTAEEYAQLIADLEGADKEAADTAGSVVIAQDALGSVLSERLCDVLEATREHAIDGRRYLQRARDVVAGWSGSPTRAALAGARKKAVPGLRSDGDALQRASSDRKGVHRTAAPSRPAQRRRAPDSGSNGGPRAPSRRSSESGNAVDAGSVRERPASSSNGDEPQLKAGARRILEEMARVHPLRLTRSQVGLATGLKITGGTFGTYWGVLKRSGYVDETGQDAGVTDAGLERAGVEPGHAASSDEIREMWRSKLKKGAREMLDLLVARHPEGYSKQELADELGMAATGGTFGTYLGTLRRNGLAVVEGSDSCYASDDLFVGA